MRREYGFERTACACRRCTISCEHVPGALSPEDLPRIAVHLGYGMDVAAFSRENLLASDGIRVTTDRGEVVHLPMLVPAAQSNGHCKFLHAGQCSIHAASPYGCAFIDAHQGNEEYAVRADALYRALYEDHNRRGAYVKVWDDLHSSGLIALPLEMRSSRLHAAMRGEKLL